MDRACSRTSSCGPDAELVKQDYSKPKRPPPKGTSAKPVKTRRSGERAGAAHARVRRRRHESLHGLDDGRRSRAVARQGTQAANRNAKRARLRPAKSVTAAKGSTRIAASACSVLRAWPARPGTCGRRRAMQRRASRSTSCVAFRPGAQQANDIVVTCSSEAGPNRCYFADPQRGFPRLAAAAMNQCSRAPAAPRDN